MNNLNAQHIMDTTLLSLKGAYHTAPAQAGPQALHHALSHAIMTEIADTWRESWDKHVRARRACYFSAEFLVGRAIYNNLLCLGLTDQVDALLREQGASLSSLEEIEDAALGNGGLGRLAACFLDSAATQNLPLDGYGIRYQYGLFRQRIEDGFQREEVDDWTRFGDPWSIRRDDRAVMVAFGDQTVRAVPYDMPVLGYRTDNVGTLRLWQAEPLEPFDFVRFNDQDYDAAMREKNRAEDISRVLYPNDTTDEGKLLRLKQQYFFSSASLQDILRDFKATHGADFSRLPDFLTVQLNDTHPVISIPELIRLLQTEGLDFDTAFGITRRIFSYTNHTVMAEALESWPYRIMEKAAPGLFEIILQVNERLLADLRAHGVSPETMARMAIIVPPAPKPAPKPEQATKEETPAADPEAKPQAAKAPAKAEAPDLGTARMAYLAVYAGRFVNGVARLHTEILKNDLLRDWYAVWPERFQNKTNGVTQRRWLGLCNPGLSALLTRLAGSDRWLTDLPALAPLAKYADDDAVIREFLDIKAERRSALAAHLLKTDGVTINPDTIYDVQIKRLHEYKRQFLGILAVLELYFEIRDGELRDFQPTTFFFAGKAAPGYVRAKGIIKLIGEVARLIAADPKVSPLIQVVFPANYNVSLAEKLIAAADVSEQISTAGTEASGTGNMKLMANGAVTLGTLDGANVEIVEEAGLANNYIFGAHIEEIRDRAADYDPNALYQSDHRIRRVLDALIDGTLSDGGTGAFRELYDSILKGASWHDPDQYYLLLDFGRYLDAKILVNRDFADRTQMARKGWRNLCASGKFSSDRSIAEYAADIWQIKPV